MEFDVSRVYTAVNAEALKVGSTVICADSLSDLKNAVENDMREATLTEIKPDDSMFRFKTVSARSKGGAYALAYLVKETTEKKPEQTDLKMTEASTAIIGATSMILKDPILQRSFEVICKENAEMKKRLSRYAHDCPTCLAFGKHCPHKVNGDPYFYDCYLTVSELEKENAELQEEMTTKQIILNDFRSRIEIADSLNKINAKLLKDLKDSKLDADVCYTDAE